jgi:hypothetical protein
MTVCSARTLRLCFSPACPEPRMPCCLTTVSVSIALFSSQICTKFDAVLLSDPSRNHIRPDTRLQLKGKDQAHPLSFVKCCTLTHKIHQYVLSTTVTSFYYKLLYRWQHQSRKLWTLSRSMKTNSQRHVFCAKVKELKLN